jgi:hypothetical protein
MMGGHLLSGGQRSPGQVLVMEPSGMISIREVNREAEEVAIYEKTSN